MDKKLELALSETSNDTLVTLFPHGMIIYILGILFAAQNGHSRPV